MQMKDFRPVNELAKRYAVKSLCYGPPGRGKTPVIQTAPRPMILVTEPGMLSLRKITNIPAWEAYDDKRIDEFFEWLFKSNETKNFDTVCIDSVSEMAEIYLKAALKKNKHGLAAYGEMADRVMPHINGLYHLQNLNTYLICKQEIIEVDNINTKQPYFPGNVCKTQIPHKYDVILHLDDYNIPNSPPPGHFRCFRTSATMGVTARDRSGNLAEFEPLDLTALFKKAML